MLKFVENMLDLLKEKNVSIQELEEKGIIGKNSFYNYRRNFPTLQSAINIANYLQFSLDYIAGFTDTNNFKPYQLPPTNFYNNLIFQLNASKINTVKFSKDLGISRTNLHRWRNGTIPYLNSLLSIAKYLECGIDDLLF